MDKIILNTKPKIIKNDKYSTINFVLIYPFYEDNVHFYEKDLIKNILLTTSGKYRTEQSFKKALLDNLIINYSVNFIKINENIYFEFNLCIPDPKKIKSFNLEKAFKFFYDSIYNPNIKEKEFNKRVFEREVSYLKTSFINRIKNIYNDSYYQFMKNFNLEYFKKTSYYYNIERLDDITPKSLYNYYEENILKNNPVVYVYGNVEELEIKNLFQKYFKFKEKEIVIEKRFYDFFKENETRYIEENSNYGNSVLYMGYVVSNMTIEDKIKLIFFNDLIKTGLGDNLLFKKLRIDNNLVYSVNSNVLSNHGVLIIETYFEQSKKEKVIELIKEVIDGFDEELVLKIKERILFEIKKDKVRSLDSKYKILNDTINFDLEIGNSLEKIENIYTNLDIKEFMEFYNRIKLDIVYFLKGGESLE